jgi:hypothetical protein
VKKTVNDCETELMDIEDNGLVWEITKMKIRRATIPYCVKKRKERTEYRTNLEKELEQIQTELDADRTEDLTELFRCTKNELQNLELQETQERVFRSKAQWAEEGEHNSSYFLSLEKRNYCNKLITQLNVKNKIIKDKRNIAEAQKSFYQTLYSEKMNQRDPTYTESLNNFTNSNNMKTLTDKEKELCDVEITEAEILNSLKNLNNEWTPGTDGLPADFYKFFWTDIKN